MRRRLHSPSKTRRRPHEEFAPLATLATRRAPASIARRNAPRERARRCRPHRRIGGGRSSPVASRCSFVRVRGCSVAAARTLPRSAAAIPSARRAAPGGAPSAKRRGDSRRTIRRRERGWIRSRGGGPREPDRGWIRRGGGPGTGTGAAPGRSRRARRIRGLVSVSLRGTRPGRRPDVRESLGPGFRFRRLGAGAVLAFASQPRQHPRRHPRRRPSRRLRPRRPSRRERAVFGVRLRVERDDPPPPRQQTFQTFCARLPLSNLPHTVRTSFSPWLPPPPSSVPSPRDVSRHPRDAERRR